MTRSAEQGLWRIMDANYNRAKEGLRVCEDIARFYSDRQDVTRKLKRFRHDLTALMLRFPYPEMIKARRVDRDVGRGSSPEEMKRNNIRDLFTANAQRCKESIRVLEETAKLARRPLAEGFKRLRYRFYRIEQDFWAH